MKKNLCNIQERFKTKIVQGIIVLAFCGMNVNSYGQTKQMLNDIPNVQQAYRFIIQNAWIMDSIKAYKSDPAFSLAIVFPELIRYSTIRNKFEIGGLLSLYVQFGKDYANFSVGHFQMKPSFAEQIETDALKYCAIMLVPAQQPEKTRRLERVKRLNNTVWQVKYLIMFIKIMDKRYCHKKWVTAEEKLKFYATAYNCGYWLPEQKIISYSNSKLFNIGFANSPESFSYSSLACSFYNL